MDKRGPIYTKWTKLDRRGPIHTKWSELDRMGPKWTEVDLIGPNNNCLIFMEKRIIHRMGLRLVHDNYHRLNLDL